MDPAAAAAPALSVQLSPEQLRLSEEEQNARCNLIINYLPQTLGQERLKAMMSVYGPVRSAKVMMDRATERSMGYGFVLFARMEDAASAIEGLNGQQLEGKVLRVKLARDPSETMSNTRVYVSHLGASVGDEQLRQMFGPFGQLVEAKTVLDPKTGASKGYGFVKFAEYTQAKNAISALNNHVPPGCQTPMQCRFADTPADKARRQKEKMQGQVGHMGMMNMFNPLGGGGGGGRGDMRGANQAMHQQQMAAAAAAAYQQQMMAQHPMYFAPPTDPSALMMQQAAAYGALGGAAQPVYNAQPYGAPMVAGGGVAPAGAVGQPSSSGFSLFIYNLPADADDAALFRWFGPYGAVMSAQVTRDKTTGVSKGYGFVSFSKFEDAQSAVVSLNGATISGKTLQVSFRAEKKGRM